MSELIFAHCNSCGREESIRVESYYGDFFVLDGEVVRTLCVPCQDGDVLDVRPNLKVVRDA